MPYGQPPFAPVQGVQFPTRGVRLYGHCTPAAYALTLRPTYVLWRFPSSYAQQCASAAGAGVASSRAVLLGVLTLRKSRKRVYTFFIPVVSLASDRPVDRKGSLCGGPFHFTD